MITIIDYGLGNVGAFANMYKRMNIKTTVAREARDLDGATHIILPGVGAFDHALELLDESGMREPLGRVVGEDSSYLLGVCVGMQILANASDEGDSAGLGWVPGKVRAFAALPETKGFAIPHMGWNDVRGDAGNDLFSGLENNARFYFLHSYYYECRETENVIGYANYGIDFSCAVQKDKVYGVQFHPEKSHHWGAQLLKNFAEL